MRGLLIFVPLILGVASLVGGLTLASRSEAGAERRLEIRFSRFQTEVITVRAG